MHLSVVTQMALIETVRAIRNDFFLKFYLALFPRKGSRGRPKAAQTNGLSLCVCAIKTSLIRASKAFHSNQRHLAAFGQNQQTDAEKHPPCVGGGSNFLDK